MSESQTASKITAELRKSMLAHDVDRSNILKMIKTALQYSALDKTDKVLSEEEAQNVLKKEQKKRLDAAKLYQDNSESTKAAKEQAEAAVIAEFLPKPLSEEEAAKLVDSSIEQLNATSIKDLGKIIAEVKQQSGNRADASLVAKLAKSKLGL